MMIPIEGNVVKDYMLGNTRIRISDAYYANRTQAELDQTMKNLVRIGWKIVREARVAGKDI